jgi:hypothetical protein
VAKSKAALVDELNRGPVGQNGKGLPGTGEINQAGGWGINPLAPGLFVSR